MIPTLPWGGALFQVKQHEGLLQNGHSLPLVQASLSPLRLFIKEFLLGLCILRDWKFRKLSNSTQTMERQGETYPESSFWLEA